MLQTALVAIEQLLSRWVVQAHVAVRSREPFVESQQSEGEGLIRAHYSEPRVLRQNDADLLEPIQQWGCFFRSLLRAVEIIAHRPFTAEQINALYAWGCAGYSELLPEQIQRMQFVLSPKCTVGALHDRLFSKALATLKISNITIRQVGRIVTDTQGITPAQKSDGNNFWEWVRGTDWQGVAFTILRGKTRAVSGRPELGLHFRYGDRDGHETWDPYSPAPTILKETAIYLYQMRRSA